MFSASTLAGRLSGLLAAGMLAALTGCAQLSTQTAGTRMHPTAAPARIHSSAAETDALKNDLAALASSVREEEAQRVADCACEYSRELAREYHVVRPALFHNFLVNVGLRKRGLCYQWAEDLLAKLQTLKLVTLELHWGIARAGTYREHNSVVVTAPGQPFAEGVVLDAWRHSGRLAWARVAADRYPWQEGELALAPEPPNGAAARFAKPR